MKNGAEHWRCVCNILVNLAEIINSFRLHNWITSQLNLRTKPPQRQTNDFPCVKVDSQPNQIQFAAMQIRMHWNNSFDVIFIIVYGVRCELWGNWPHTACRSANVRVAAPHDAHLIHTKYWFARIELLSYYLGLDLRFASAVSLPERRENVLDFIAVIFSVRQTDNWILKRNKCLALDRQSVDRLWLLCWSTKENLNEFYFNHRSG